jgi:cytochrome c-type biogenesis protein CcmH/NrfF
MLNKSASIWLGVTLVLVGVVNVCLVPQAAVSWILTGLLTLIGGALVCLIPGKVAHSHPRSEALGISRDRRRALSGAPRKSERKPQGFKRGLLFLVLTASALAQTESQIGSNEVKRVGSHLNCQCGGCNDDVNCMMSSGQCPFCKPARTKIFRMQQAGMTDSGIVASFVRDLGDKVFRLDPGSSFWLVPYFSLGAGGLIVAFMLMRMRSRSRNHKLLPASAGVTDPSFALYREAIEKDTAELE